VALICRPPFRPYGDQAATDWQCAEPSRSMKVLLAGLIGFLIGVACTVAYYEFDNEPEEDEGVITEQERPQVDRPRPIQP
jgi:hypothetical protein